MLRKDISGAIRAALEAAVPSVKWTERLQGASRGKDIIGSVTCDRVSYRWDDKTTLIATATYSIYLVDTPSTGTVDDLADAAFAALHADDLGGIAVDSNILNVMYGCAQGKSDIGVVLMEYQVEYVEEW